MTFDARKAAEAQGHLQPFGFTGLDGQDYRLPNMRTVESGLLERFTSGDFEALSEIAEEDAYQAITEMPSGVAEKLIEAWADHAGMLGKAPQPSSRSRKRGRQRRRT